LRVWQTYRHALQLSPGVIDAALSSLAGFAASLYAVRFLDASELGTYGLYLSASIVASLVPQQLLFLPAQITVLELPAARRSIVLASSLLRGGVLSALVMPFVALAGLVTGAQVGADTRVALAFGAILLTALTPMQDHVRSILYLCDRPQLGALVSACQLVVTIPALVLMHVAGAGDAWIPFGATALGLVASMAVGLASAGDLSANEPMPASSTRELTRVGRPLLPAALVQEATVFAGSALLVALTSAATLGTAEAARIVSRPVQAFSLGISRSLAPRLMESGQARSPEVAKSAAGLYAAAIVVAGLAYMAIAGWAYPHSPMVRLLPAAYEAQGLVALFLLATSLGAIAQIPRGILLGAGEGRTILAITTMTSAVRLTVVALLAGVFGAYAPPAAQLVSLNVTGLAGTRAVVQLMKRGQVALTCRHVSPS
jgi:hypothetical protein